MSCISQFNWKKELKEIFMISLLGIPWGILTCWQCLESTRATTLAISLAAVMWVVLWKGNAFMAFLVDIRYDWLKVPITRLVVGVLSHTLFTALTIFVLFHAFGYFLNVEMGNVYSTIYMGIGVTMIVSLILYSRSFLMSWKELAIESEKIKKDAISARYEVLKSQVNPHFLFNSLNTLTNLVYENQDVAASFIKQLSEVYRYVLEIRDKELVRLEEELKFTRSYIYLQQLRHEDSLKVELEVEDCNGMVVPLSIQMLVENAIKHNVVSEDEPLFVKIYRAGNLIIVENNVQRKNTIQGESSGVGLDNIRSRYNFLSETTVEIEESLKSFKVTLPILNSVDS